MLRWELLARSMRTGRGHERSEKSVDHIRAESHIARVDLVDTDGPRRTARRGRCECRCRCWGGSDGIGHALLGVTRQENIGSAACQSGALRRGRSGGFGMGAACRGQKCLVKGRRTFIVASSSKSAIHGFKRWQQSRRTLRRRHHIHWS